MRCIFQFITVFTLSFSSVLALAESEFAPGERFTEETVVEGIPIPTAIAFAPDSRIFIALKEGGVRVIQQGTLLVQPFIDLSAIVNRSTDRGLLGIAVDPNFPRKPYVYLSYVWDPPGFQPDGKDARLIRVVRYQADAAQNYNVAIPDSEEIILGKNSRAEFIAPALPVGASVPNPEPASCKGGLTTDGAPIEDCIPCDSLSHTAGTLMFLNDGTLLASFGDGANYDYPSLVSFNAQDLDAMTGRVVRIDPDTGTGVAGNPYFDPARPSTNRSRLWSLGYRNPFRITFNPANGQVYAGDVGTSYYEEINTGKGGNFGWPCYEGGFTDRAQEQGAATISERQVGFKRAPSTSARCDALYAQGAGAVIAPLFTYRHPYDASGKDLGSSITGLAFYSGTTYPERYRGALFFSDYARHFIRYLTFDQSGAPTMHEFAKEVGSNFGAVQLLTGPDTNLYGVYLDLKTRTGVVRRFKPVIGSNNPPIAKASVDHLYGSVPLVVSFSSAGSVDPDGQDISIEWSFGDGERSTDPNPMHIYKSIGTFSATMTVKELTAPFAATSKSFTIRTGANAPVASIEAPGTDLRYRIGEEVSFAGSSTPATGVSLSWSILLRHNQHEHLISEIAGPRGSFIPEEHCDNCSYELCLLAQNPDGLKDQRCQSVLPLTSNYNFGSNPPGAPITYIDEDLEVIAPYVAKPIVGSRQTIAAAPIANGRSFQGWSDGVQSQTRTFLVGEQDLALVAIYANQAPTIRVASIRSRSAKGRKLQLEAGRSSDPEGEPLTFVWTFSDGVVVRGPTATRHFRHSGTYRVRLIARDRLGAKALFYGSIKVGRTTVFKVTGRPQKVR